MDGALAKGNTDLRFEWSPREGDDLRSDLYPKRGEVHATLMHSLSRQSTLPQNKNATPAGVAFFRCRPMMGSNTSEGDGPIVGQLAARGVKKLLLSAKLQNATISLSAMPINRRCGLLFGKVSPPFRLSFIGCPLKRENGRHEMWPNVFFKPLRALEYGEFY